MKRQRLEELRKAVGDKPALETLHGLLECATSYTRIQERWCSEDMSQIPGREEATKRLEKSLEEKIRAYAKGLPNVKGVKFTGDPRGYCVRLMLEDGRYNTWGGAEDGWGVA